MQGFTDFTLAKRSLLAAFKRGMVGRTDICDAHPELVRAARNIGTPQMSPCPVCGEASLKVVRYVYGDQLKDLSGRTVYPEGWELELNERFDEFRCYAVEVCPECSWNHLASCCLMGRRYENEAPRRRSRGKD